MWRRNYIENNVKAVKKVAFLHNVLNDAIEEMNGIFTIEVSITLVNFEINLSLFLILLVDTNIDHCFNKHNTHFL